MACLRRKRAVKSDHVGGPQELFQWYVAYAKSSALGGLDHIAGQQRHAESEQDARHRGADLARPDNPDRTAMKLGAEEPLEREIAVANPAERPVNLAFEGQDQSHRVLGDR